MLFNTKSYIKYINLYLSRAFLPPIEAIIHVAMLVCQVVILQVCQVVILEYYWLFFPYLISTHLLRLIAQVQIKNHL